MDDTFFYLVFHGKVFPAYEKIEREPGEEVAAERFFQIWIQQGGKHFFRKLVPEEPEMLFPLLMQVDGRNFGNNE